MAAEYGSYLGAFVLIVLVIRSLIVVAAGDPSQFPFGFNPDSGCGEVGYSCGVISGIAMTILSLSLGSVAFLFWRLGHVQYPYMFRAEKEPRDLVPTAGSIVGEVVGRDELCHVIMDDLRDRERRRPHLLVGGVGVGKTAVMVQLTKLLAEAGAVPVPIRLRDAQEKLRFIVLAREVFVHEAEDTLLSDGEGEKVWRRLLRDDRVVVLADGLEEALAEGDAERERDNLIRFAIREAERQRLPLVVATRPHEPLTGIDAAVLELEPLSEEAALDYIEVEGPVGEAHRLDWVVETADVVETPLYLRVARQLHEQRLLHRAGPMPDVTKLHRPGVDPIELRVHLDTRGVDRVELRVRLMRTWTNALVAGYFYTELPLDVADRLATVHQLAALACMGLRDDTLEVKFDALPQPVLPPARRATRPSTAGASAGRTDPAARRPRAPKSGAASADDHGLTAAVVEELATLNRLPMDIRLAATRGAQLELVETRKDGVRFPHSIMQAYLGSRMMEHALEDESYLDEALKPPRPGRELLAALVMHAHGSLVAGSYKRWRWLTDRLAKAADDRPRDAKTIDLLAAALEIDSVDENPAHPVLARKLRDRWKIQVTDDRTVEDAKLSAVARFGDVARNLSARRRESQRQGRSRRPRSKLVCEPEYLALLQIARQEQSYPVRLAIAHELGAGGDDAYSALAECLGPRAPAKSPVWRDWLKRDEDHRQRAMSAWLAPLLVGSTEKHEESAKSDLRDWVAYVGRRTSEGEDVLPISLEVALAQGFKHAANRRRDHPHARAVARDLLREQARAMLRRARFWFSRLTLVHALTLWELPEDPEPEPAIGRGSETGEVVEGWLASRDRDAEHPFVDEASELARLALDEHAPERFMWIDESGVVTRVGSRPTRRGVPRKHNLWIPPSTGWTALHPRALRLVGDVLLLLNLAERGRTPLEREERMRLMFRDDLPPCLVSDRRPLHPGLTVGMAETFPPGSRCKKGCPFELCPYPPKGEQTHRVELSEAFCRRQQYLFGRARGRVGPGDWQDRTPRAELKDFWGEMATRAKR